MRLFPAIGHLPCGLKVAIAARTFSCGQRAGCWASFDGASGQKDPAWGHRGQYAETVSPGEHPDMDYAEHEATYAFFLRLIKYLVAAVVIILIILAFLWG